MSSREPSRPLSLGHQVRAAIVVAIALAASSGCSGSSGHEELFLGTYVGSYSGVDGEATARIYDLGEGSLYFTVETDPLAENPCNQLRVQVNGPTSATLGSDSVCSPSWVAESASVTLDGDDLSVTWTSRFTGDDGASETRELSFEGQRADTGDGADAG